MNDETESVLEEDERGAPYEQESRFAKLLLLLVVIASSVIFALLALVWASETVIDLTTDGRTDRINAACGDDTLVGWSMQEHVVMVQCDQTDSKKDSGGLPHYEDDDVYLMYGDYVVAVEP